MGYGSGVVLHFVGDNIGVERLAYRAFSASAELLVVLLFNAVLPITKKNVDYGSRDVLYVPSVRIFTHGM